MFQRPIGAYIFACACPVFAAGCSSQGQTAPPIPSSPAASAFVRLGIPPAGRPSAFARQASWMKAGVKNDKLLYVSDLGDDTVKVYQYPLGAQVGVLTGFSYPTGLCSDAAGNVYVDDQFASAVFEFAHGGTTPIGTFSTVLPLGCAVDPKSGDLAITGGSGGSPTVEVYRSGVPTAYSDANFAFMFFAGFDNVGNLWIDGIDGDDGFRYAELPHGAAALVDVALRAPIGDPGGIAWDGKDMAVGDSSQGANAVIYQTLGAAVLGSTTLNGVTQTFQYSISGVGKQRKIIAPDAAAGTGIQPNANADAYPYPAGGNPVRFVGNLILPYGSAISK